MKKQTLYNYLFFLFPIAYFLSLPIVMADLAVWIAHGKYFLETHSILYRDIFSILPTAELIYPVGTSILYGIIYKFTGIIGTSLFHKFIVLLILAIWYWVGFRGKESPWTTGTKLIVLLTWFGCSLFCVDRPALLAMLPLLVSFIILQKDDELSLKDLIFLNLINLIWVNLHGSWILLIAMYGWREFFRMTLVHKKINWQKITWFLSLFLTSLLNPFGYKVFPYLLETARISKERKFSEWGYTDFSGHFASQAAVYYLLLFLIILFVIYIFRMQRERFNTLIASPFFLLLLLGLVNIRNTALPFFVLIPFAFQFKLLTREKKYNKGNRNIFELINIFFVAITIGVTILFLPYIKPTVENFLPLNKKEVFDEYAPFKIATYLEKTTNDGPIFNEWEYGSFLILMQEHKIFGDTRNIIYNNENVLEYRKVISGVAGWDKILNKYKIRYVLVNVNKGSELIKKMIDSKKWELVTQEKETVLYERKMDISHG